MTADKDMSTAALLDKIKERDQKIERYEKRLTDVVVAFKNLQKEKTALEETLKQVKFSSTSPASIGSGGSPGSSSDGKDESAATRSSKTADASDYEARIAKLLDSVNSLTQQKNDMQASYQADRRKLREEYEHQLSEQKRDLESCAIVRRDLEAQLAELRSRAKQQARVEQDSGALAKQLAAETAAREAAQSQAREASDAAARLSAEHSRTVARLERALDTRRAEAAAQAGSREARAGELEGRIAELSASLGEAERRRHVEAKAAARLKERVDCLERENRALVSQQQSQQQPQATEGGSASAGSASAHPVAVVEPLRRSLLAQLSTESAKSDEALYAAELAASEAEAAAAAAAAASLIDQHASCREQQRQLRVELDACRQRLAAASTAASSSSASADSELRAFRERCQALEAEATRREQATRRREAETERARREETARLRRELTARALEAEAELARHRDRTLRLLAEKDAELAEAMGAIGRLANSGTGAGAAGGISRGGGGETPLATEDENGVVVSRLRPSAAACTSVHAQLEEARAQADVAALREARRHTEHRLRCLQAEVAEHRQIAADLRVELARCRQPTRESAEYVRNLVYRYLTLADERGDGARRTVLTALCTVLNFSDAERHKALQKQMATSSWW